MGIPQDVLWDVTPDDELPNGRTTPTEMRAISWDVPRSAHQDERHSDPMDHPIGRPHDDGMPWWHAMGPKHYGTTGPLTVKAKPQNGRHLMQHSCLCSDSSHGPSHAVIEKNWDIPCEGQ